MSIPHALFWSMVDVTFYLFKSEFASWSAYAGVWPGGVLSAAGSRWGPGEADHQDRHSALHHQQARPQPWDSDGFVQQLFASHSLIIYCSLTSSSVCRLCYGRTNVMGETGVCCGQGQELITVFECPTAEDYGVPGWVILTHMCLAAVKTDTVGKLMWKMPFNFHIFKWKMSRFSHQRSLATELTQFYLENKTLAKMG